MSETDRIFPTGKQVSLFITCMGDVLHPQTGLAVVHLLTSHGYTADFPSQQTCCGQPAFNAGHWAEAKQLARHHLHAFRRAQIVVAPSVSCVAMIRHEYPKLFADEPTFLSAAKRLAAVTWELTEFLVDVAGVEGVNGRLPEPTRIGFHDACHGLRGLQLHDQPRQLARSVENAAVQEMPESDVCCGFGGLFSIKMADISGDMLRRKMAHIEAFEGQVLTCEVSCLTHINAGLAKAGSAKRVQHVADFLAGAQQGEAAE